MARLNEDDVYEYLGVGTQLARQREFGFWLRRTRGACGPNLPLNLGLRYDLQMPFVALNNSYSIGDFDDVFGVSGAGNLFKPGTMTGTPPTFRQLGEGRAAVPDGLEQRRAERRRGVDADAPVMDSCGR